MGIKIELGRSLAHFNGNEWHTPSPYIFLFHILTKLMTPEEEVVVAPAVEEEVAEEAVVEEEAIAEEAETTEEEVAEEAAE